MPVNNVIARMYDAGPSKVSTPVADSENGFTETVQTAIADQVVTQDCCCCKNGDANIEPVVKTGAEAGAVAAPASIENSEGEVNRSAMFKFTMFIRISSDFGAVQESLVDKFKEATREFVSALRSDDQHDLPVLDSYLNQADASVASGLQSAKAFLDNILSAADNGLKSITNAMTSSSWMSGMNLSSGSGGLTSVSSVDIAKLQLQNALENKSLSASTGAGKVSYSSGHTLELIKGIADPVKVDANGLAGSASAASAASAVNSANTAYSAGSTQLTTDNAGVADRIGRRDRILDRFLQLIDDLSMGSMNGSSVVRAAFSFSYNGVSFKDSTEAGKAIGTAATDKVTLQEDNQSIDAAEEIIT